MNSYFDEEENEEDSVSSNNSSSSEEEYYDSNNDDDDSDDENFDEDDDISSVDEDNLSSKTIKKNNNSTIYEEDYNDYHYDDSKFKKLENINRSDYIQEHHPELLIINNDETNNLCKITRNSDNIIIDKFHKTAPFLTKYEKAKIIGQRAKQINNGSNPYLKVPDNIIDGAIIAKMELDQKLIPFTIKRPLPNGGCEYWRLSDLELID
uniref:DNA-directed RNA polymerase n=1 Tax=viral metagenome TaxID=1070528 RepID=A0A6C0H6K3_9ZZZZ